MRITIDGPAGAGKSTAARNLATALGISFLDTGATYRAVVLRALRADDDLHDAAILADHARKMDLAMRPQSDGLGVLLDGGDVSDEIRAEVVSRNAHYAANVQAVRDVLVARQREIGASLGSFVAEGRDQGTVVFPEADLKFYLDADLSERAQRRCAELARRGEPADYDTVLQTIASRDESDQNRSVGPLRVPDGAIRIDTSGWTIEQTLAELLRHVRAKESPVPENGT